MPEHYGQSYGKATRKILLERPHELLKERLSNTRHRCFPKRRNTRFSTPAEYDDRAFDGHCRDYMEHCFRSGDHREHDRNGPVHSMGQFGFVAPAYFYFEGIPGWFRLNSEVEQNSDGAPEHERRKYPHEHHKARQGRHASHPPPQPTCRKPATEMRTRVLPLCDRRVYDSDPRMRMRPKAVPFRYCCVAPKYTGHIPGMQFVFGEAFGPSSDRLLRRHHDNLQRMNSYR
ncbi:uncharacterized protein CEXT_18161 [Caerostris extrusa]|uniref:Uncharacterized protein n=1 Tax=Caerostris extrusa TaxID=172846 RepID=A0AAV4Y5Y9_CAEEX|nr:uncharacterized protein CEXT_18161 [Caerostris extrusa]